MINRNMLRCYHCGFIVWSISLERRCGKCEKEMMVFIEKEFKENAKRRNNKRKKRMV